MSRRTLAIILIVVGLGLAVLSASADAIGIGLTPDVFGFGQIAGLIVGIVLLVIGLYLLMSASQVAAAQPETLAKPTASAAPTAPDKLTQIEGIGPKIQSILHENGITTFKAVAEAGSDTLTDVLQTAEFQAPFDASSWPEQAALAAAGDWNGLKELQDQLKGGRRD